VWALSVTHMAHLGAHTRSVGCLGRHMRDFGSPHSRLGVAGTSSPGTLRARREARALRPAP